MTRRFHVRTFGCQMNEHDSERIAGLLAAQGMERSDDAESADVVVLNTCCIRENADNKLYGQLGHLKSLKARRPGLQIAVGGCLAQKDRERIVERAAHVDVVFGTHNLHRAAELLDEARRADGPLVEIADEHRPDAASLDAELPAARVAAHAAWVTIQIGCDNSCTFCIVPIVRGPEVSRRMGDVVREVEELAAGGVREVTLLGQNVNSYGRDLGAGQWSPRFADLLRAVDGIEGIRRIRFTSPHPKDLRADTIAAMAECPAVCEQLHLPLQAGSDRTLARMHRGYTFERYLARLEAARAAIPDLAVTTDLIVGFPGETDDDFEQTLGRRRDRALRRGLHVRLLAAPRDTGRGDDRARRAPGDRQRADGPADRRRRTPRARPERDARRAKRGGPRRGPVEEGSEPTVGSDPAGEAAALRRRRHRRTGRCARGGDRHPRGPALARR